LAATGDDSDTPVEQFSRYIRRPKRHVEEEDNCGQPRPLDADRTAPTTHPQLVIFTYGAVRPAAPTDATDLAALL